MVYLCRNSTILCRAMKKMWINNVDNVDKFDISKSLLRLLQYKK